ncbi:heterokaryon incompatibility protein-domain-containing protein, partial [Lophiotrema nucula]
MFGISLDPTQDILYRPLPKDGRLLRILRLAPGTFGEPLHGQLIQDNLESQIHEYCALSYVWGKPTEQRYIYMNGRPHQIMPSLYEALQHIRTSTETLFIWADALCINQQDVEERNSQVAMMAQIYSMAKEVLVWLGVADYDTMFTGASGMDVDRLFDRLNGRNTNNIWYHVMRKHEDSLRNVCNRDYWSRAWTIQEFALAKSIVLFCGNNRMNLANFLDGMA